MPTYLVVRDFPGVTLAQLTEAHRRVLPNHRANDAGKLGAPICPCRLRAGRVAMMYLFEATSVAYAMEANQA